MENKTTTSMIQDTIEVSKDEHIDYITNFPQDIVVPEGMKLRRRFLGTINPTKEDVNCRFEQKHLKAYLQGKNFFTYGFNKLGEPILHPVKSEFYYE